MPSQNTPRGGERTEIKPFPLEFTSNESTALTGPKTFPTTEVCVSDWDSDLNFQGYIAIRRSCLVKHVKKVIRGYYLGSHCRS